MQAIPQGHQDSDDTRSETHLTMAQAKKIMKLAREGQQSKAWKMLHSPGLAATTMESFEAAKHKLMPRQDAPIKPTSGSVFLGTTHLITGTKPSRICILRDQLTQEVGPLNCGRHLWQDNESAENAAEMVD